MDIEEVLKKATPRPWQEGDFSDDICGPLGPDEQPICGDFNDHCGGDWMENHTLVLLAVNAFEADRELIRRLVAALEIARNGYITSGPTALIIDAALAAAKERP